MEGSLKGALEETHQERERMRNFATAKCMNCNLEMQLSTFTDHAATCNKANDAIDMCETTSEANDHQICNSDSIVQELQTIFADRAIEDLQLEAAQSSDIHAAEDIIVDQQMELSAMESDPTHPKVSTEHRNKKVDNLQQILHKFRKGFLSNHEIRISIDRDEIWPCGFLFYKKCINDPKRLKMKFEVNFTGLTREKSGMVAGAESYELFGVLLKEVSLRLLEGKEKNLVPERVRGNVTNFVILGMLVGQFLLNRDPCIAIMAPWVYDMM